MTKWEELPMGRCSLLVGLRSSSQSGIWEVWRERLQIRESVGAMQGLRVLRALGKSPSGPAPLLGFEIMIL